MIRDHGIATHDVAPECNPLRNMLMVPRPHAGQRRRWSRALTMV